MDREGFRNRLKQYKQAREENPGLKYWVWKDIPKYDEGTENVSQWKPRITAEGYDDKGYYAQAMNSLPEVTVVGSKTRARSELPMQFTYVNGYPEATTITTDYNVGAGALEGVYPEFEILTGAKLLSNSLLSNSLTNELKFNNPPLSRTRKVNRNSVAAKRHLGTYNQSTDEISGNTIGQLLTDDGTEQFVFNSLRKDNEVFKMPNSYGRRSVEDLYKKAQEYLKFNKVPNYSKVRLEGHVDNGRGVLYPIFSQKRLQTLNDDIYSISGNQRWNNEIIPSLDKAMSKYGYKNIDGKYIKGNKIVGDIHPGNIGYISNGDIKLIDAHIDGFAEGGEVTGPPTEEQWYADMTKYNPTILDNASMYWSIEQAKKDLHAQAMGLPGYAPMWNEYMRTLPKDDPDINEFVDELWENENPNNVGYNKSKNKYFPHKSPEGGKATIGPGFKMGSGSHNISEREAKNGVTKARLNQEARKIGKEHLKAVDQFLNYGQDNNPADTISPQIKMGLMDLRHQVGPLNGWHNLRNAVLEGDLDRIKKESTVTWDDNGVTKVDKRRKKLRDEKYWHY